MKAKHFNQIFFSLLILAFGAWAFYEYKKSQKEQVKEVLETTFLTKGLKELQALRIKKQDIQLEVVREEPDWLLKQPVKDRASFKEISRWFDEIKNQKVQQIKNDEKIKWENYHLDQAPQVEMEFSSGEAVSFFVSRKGFFNGKYFVRKGEDLYVAEAYFASEVNNKNFDDFRSKKIFSFEDHVTRIKFQGKERFKVQWTGNKWSLDEAQPFPLDENRLDDFLSDVKGMEAEGIKEAVTLEFLKKYSLHKPQLKILFYNSSDKEYNLTLSPIKEDKAFVVVSGRDYIFEISKDKAEKLILSKNQIRDHAFPFNYNISSVTQIERKNTLKSFSIKKVRTNQWTVSEEKKEASEDPEKSTDQQTKNAPIDPKKVDNLLDKIKKLKGEKYKTGAESQNNRSLIIKNKDGEIIFELKEVSVSKSYSWLKTNLWHELVAVSKTSVDEIFNYSIYLAVKKPKERKAKKDDQSKESKKSSSGKD